jgi:hypothetical protein
MMDPPVEQLQLQIDEFAEDDLPVDVGLGHCVAGGHDGHGMTTGRHNIDEHVDLACDATANVGRG